MDPVAQSVLTAADDLGIRPEAVATLRKYWLSGADDARSQIASARGCWPTTRSSRFFSGRLRLSNSNWGGPISFELRTIAVRELDDAALMRLSREGQLYLQLAEMQTIRQHFRDLGREPTDVELETIAQTWSEHCSHKTLAGRIAYRDENGERQFENMLKETIFAATQKIRERLGSDDWCVSVFEDNAGIVRFDENFNVAFKVETHNHPSALEPYGGANTGVGGVIRDIMGTGHGGEADLQHGCVLLCTAGFGRARRRRPRCRLPPGVLHPRRVMRGVVEGVRDYGNRMGIPTVNGAVYFDERYLGNPLVYCGNVGLLPRDKSHKQTEPGDLIVTVGGRTGRDGIHGATFSSAELTSQSEHVSGGAVQIGNAIEEKKVLDVLLVGSRSRAVSRGDRLRGRRIQQCGRRDGREDWRGGASRSCAAEIRGAVVHRDLDFRSAGADGARGAGGSSWPELEKLCRSENVEATAIGRFVPTGRLQLYYEGNRVADLEMEFLHKGRPPVVRQAVWQEPTSVGGATGTATSGRGILRRITRTTC